MQHSALLCNARDDGAELSCSARQAPSGLEDCNKHQMQLGRSLYRCFSWPQPVALHLAMLSAPAPGQRGAGLVLPPGAGGAQERTSCAI